jgi:hypothetical protein
MTLRRWMLLVLVTALMLARGIWGQQRKSTYRVLALYHAADEMNCRAELRVLQSPSPPRLNRQNLSRLMNAVASTPGSKDLLTTWNGPPVDVQLPPITGEALVALQRREVTLAAKIAYHARMRRKYEWLTCLPWLPVWPDPPEPK